MSNVWKSDLSNKRKLNLFRATSESILLLTGVKLGLSPNVRKLVSTDATLACYE